MAPPPPQDAGMVPRLPSLRERGTKTGIGIAIGRVIAPRGTKKGTGGARGGTKMMTREVAVVAGTSGNLQAGASGRERDTVLGPETQIRIRLRIERATRDTETTAPTIEIVAPPPGADAAHRPGSVRSPPLAQPLVPTLRRTANESASATMLLLDEPRMLPALTM